MVIFMTVASLLQIMKKLFQQSLVFLPGMSPPPWACREPSIPAPWAEDDCLHHHGHCTTMGLFAVQGSVSQHGCTPYQAQLKREMGTLFFPHVEESLLLLTSSLLQEIL